MTRQEQRIAKIRKRISLLDKQIDAQFKKHGDVHVSRLTDRLQDRRDTWEGRLVRAELA